jgi:hypothetical protein
MLRARAEQFLVDKPFGYFIVRPSSMAGCLSLSHRDMAGVGHGIIHQWHGYVAFFFSFLVGL